MRTAIFESSTAAYLDCVQKGLFGSSLPWPLQIKPGDYCFLYHYEVGTLFGLWQAGCDGGENLVPRVWGGRFPFRVKVELVTPEIIEIPKAKVGEPFLDAATGKLQHVIEGSQAEPFLRTLVPGDGPLETNKSSGNGGKVWRSGQIRAGSRGDYEQKSIEEKLAGLTADVRGGVRRWGHEN